MRADRMDRYGEPIILKKYNKKAIFSNHKVSFVDEIQNRTKQFESHPDTERHGHLLMNNSLNIKKIVTFSNNKSQFQTISYCQEHKEDNKFNED